MGIFAGGVTGGATVYWLLSVPAEEDVAATPRVETKANTDWSRLLSSLDEANQELAAAKRQIASLEAQLTATPAPVAVAAQPEATPEPMSADQRRSARMQRFAERRLEMRERELGQVVQLEPWQQERLGVLMQRARDLLQAEMEARQRGEAYTGEDPWALYERELQGILTPEQLAAYQGYQADVRQGRLETISNATMSRLTAGLGLDDQQKDMVYSAIYQAADQSFDTAGEMGNPRGFGETVLGQLRNSLTPEQFQAVSERMQSGFGPGGGPPPPN